MSTTPDRDAQFAALSDSAIVADVSNRSQLVMRGANAASFLHSFCTNEINKLSEGQGCEAFLPTVQGKIVGYVSVFRRGDDLMLESSAGQAAKIHDHLDRYVIREDVEIEDCSEQLGQLVLAGPKAIAVVQEALSVSIPAEPMGHCAAEWNGHSLSIRNTRWLGPGTAQISCPREAVSDLLSMLSERAVPCDDRLVQTARLLAGSPEYGSDVTEANLPQEVNRDDWTISFVKGCYLGQEPVARIDALGHVNRKLAALRCQEPLPAVPSELQADGKKVGVLTSVAEAPGGGVLGLGMVRCSHLSTGKTLTADFGEVEILEL